MKKQLILIVFCMTTLNAMDITAPNTKDSQGISPLNWAAGQKNLSLCKSLMAQGARADVYDSFDCKKFPHLKPSALETATSNNQIALCIAILEHNADGADCEGPRASAIRTSSCVLAKKKGFNRSLQYYMLNLEKKASTIDYVEFHHLIAP